MIGPKDYAVWMYHDVKGTRAFWLVDDLPDDLMDIVLQAGNGAAARLGEGHEFEIVPLDEALETFRKETPPDMLALYEDGGPHPVDMVHHFTIDHLNPGGNIEPGGLVDRLIRLQEGDEGYLEYAPEPVFDHGHLRLVP